MKTDDIARMLLHEEMSAERVRMVARVVRKRTERERTLNRRAERHAKWTLVGKA